MELTELYLKMKTLVEERHPFLPGCRPIIQDTDGWYGVVLTKENAAGHIEVIVTDRGTSRWHLPERGDVIRANHVSHSIIRGYI